MKTKMLFDDKNNLIGRYDERGNIYTPGGEFSYPSKVAGNYMAIVENKAHTKRVHAFHIERIHDTIVDEFTPEERLKLEEEFPGLYAVLRPIFHGDLKDG